MQSYIDANEEVITGQKDVMYNCLQVLWKRSGREYSDKSRLNYLNLPPLTE